MALDKAARPPQVLRSADIEKVAGDGMYPQVRTGFEQGWEYIRGCKKG